MHWPERGQGEEGVWGAQQSGLLMPASKQGQVGRGEAQSHG